VCSPPCASGYSDRGGRESLRELDERLLQDIGVRHEQALHEARKPFWKA
jgi:uncharacterized protein YjiS (DUF1127 family)